MTRYTSAYSNLVLRLEEINTLIRVSQKIKQKEPLSSTEEINAISRSAVVLLSSHIEGYFKDLGELVLYKIFEKSVSRTKMIPRFFYYLSKTHIDEISTTKDPDKIANKVFNFIESDNDFWRKTGPLPDNINPEVFNYGFSNPTHKKIKSYIGRFGYENFHADIGQELQRDVWAAINMVDHVVDTRNKIAHGDMSIKETPESVCGMIMLIQKYCKASDKIFASWCSKNLCKIRS